MLVTQVQGSFGAGGNVVTLTTRTIQNLAFVGGDCESGVRFGSDGVLYAKTAAGAWQPISGEWLLSGSGSGFYVSRSIVSGTLTTDAGAGPLQLNANRDYDILQSGGGSKTTVLDFEIASDVSGSPVEATARITLIAEYDTE